MRSRWKNPRVVHRRPVLLVLVAALTALATGRASSSPTAAVAALCGVERWPVKTLTDPRARLVRLKPRPATVRALRRLRPPADVANSPRIHGVETTTYRIHGVETTTYRVRAALIGTKHEDDGDFHLVIADPRNLNQTMIVEFPIGDGYDLQRARMGQGPHGRTG